MKDDRAKSRQEIQGILDKIELKGIFKSWKIVLKADGLDAKGNERWTLQLLGRSPCSVTGEMEDWSGRKFFITQFMCHNEIVRTAKMAFDRAVEHERDEYFQYDGVAVDTPHKNYKLIVRMAKEHPEEFTNSRTNGMQGI